MRSETARTDYSDFLDGIVADTANLRLWQIGLERTQSAIAKSASACRESLELLSRIEAIERQWPKIG